MPLRPLGLAYATCHQSLAYRNESNTATATPACRSVCNVVKATPWCFVHGRLGRQDTHTVNSRLHLHSTALRPFPSPSGPLVGLPVCTPLRSKGMAGVAVPRASEGSARMRETCAISVAWAPWGSWLAQLTLGWVHSFILDWVYSFIHMYSVACV